MKIRSVPTFGTDAISSRASGGEGDDVGALVLGPRAGNGPGRAVRQLGAPHPGDLVQAAAGQQQQLEQRTDVLLGRRGLPELRDLGVGQDAVARLPAALAGERRRTGSSRRGGGGGARRTSSTGRRTGAWRATRTGRRSCCPSPGTPRCAGLVDDGVNVVAVDLGDGPFRPAVGEAALDDLAVGIEAEQSRRPLPASGLRLGVVLDEVAGGLAEACWRRAPTLDAPPDLLGLVVGDDVLAHGALASDVGGQAARCCRGQRLTDDRLALGLVGEVHRAEHQLRRPAVRAPEAHREGLVTGGLNDQVEAGSAAVPYLAALGAGAERT